MVGILSFKEGVLGSALYTMIPEDHIYHLIHPRSAMIVDSVKIKTSLIMSDERMTYTPGQLKS